MTDAPENEALPPSLRLLKGLVIVLMLTMIAGVITVAAVIVTRMPDASGARALPLPDQIALPAGTRAAAVTTGMDWLGVVTDDNRILIFNADGSLRQEINIAPANAD